MREKKNTTSVKQSTINMTSRKEIPNVEPMYIYEDPKAHRRVRWSRIPIVNYFRRKFKMDIEEIEGTRQGIMKKDGHYRVRYDGLSNYRQEYLHDMYTSLIDLKWRYALAAFFSLYLVSFFFFAVIWWFIAYSHGDFENANTPNWDPCATNMYSFGECFLFSIELQTTIGYGGAYPSTDCSGALFTLYLQLTVGLLLDSLMMGFIFVKFSQPKKRQNTVLFSTNACITFHGGELSLQVRVGDTRKCHLLAVHVFGALVRRHLTDEGILIPLYQNNVEFRADGMDSTVLLLWPVILKHQITKDSPFWDIKPANLTDEKYELVLFIEGTIENTGEVCQVRTSYTPKEFLWGYRFDEIEQYDSANGRWEIDFSSFNDVVYTSNIQHSAKELATLRTNKTVSFINDDDCSRFNEILQIETKNMRSVSYDALPPLFSSKGKKGIKFDSLRCVDANVDSGNSAPEHELRKVDSDISFQTADDKEFTRDDDEENN